MQLMQNLRCGNMSARIWDTDDMCLLLQKSHVMFPNIRTILKVLLTMPMSTSTAERTFSTLRRLKTYLRNFMTEERLSSLALMAIHLGYTGLGSA